MGHIVLGLLADKHGSFNLFTPATVGLAVSLCAIASGYVFLFSLNAILCHSLFNFFTTSQSMKAVVIISIFYDFSSGAWLSLLVSGLACYSTYWNCVSPSYVPVLNAADLFVLVSELAWCSQWLVLEPCFFGLCIWVCFHPSSYRWRLLDSYLRWVFHPFAQLNCKSLTVVVVWTVLILCDCGHVLVYPTTCIAKEAESSSYIPLSVANMWRVVRFFHSVPSSCSKAWMSASTQYDEYLPDNVHDSPALNMILTEQFSDYIVPHEYLVYDLSNSYIGGV